ncbi:MAG: hypothetical protein ABIS50_26175 [Luteolibacter sp.]|uniref:hypothetical protein n=1 Tax=Luteolibacter sp. TaxID=1962973 RepID=UPI0032666292
MLSRKIQLLAAVDSFKFTDGSRDFGFDTKLFLNSEGLIAGVGSKPADDGSSYTEVKLFEGSENSHDLLIAALHYGLQHFRGRLRILPSHLDVQVARDLVDHLRGFEKPIFEQAGRDARASTVSVSRIAVRSETTQNAEQDVSPNT